MLIPYGVFSFDAVGAALLVSPPAAGVPPLAEAALTTVVMVPAGVTSRTALLKVSAMNRAPAPSRARPWGSLSRGLGVGPPPGGEGRGARRGSPRRGRRWPGGRRRRRPRW